MNIKIMSYISLILCIIMLASCSKNINNESTGASNTVIIQENNSPIITDFKSIFDKKIDINSDGIEDVVKVFINEENFLTKIIVNKFEKVYDFAYAFELGTEEVRLVSLGNGRKAILIGTGIDSKGMLNRVNFNMFEFKDDKVENLISSTDLPINMDGNYRVDYISGGYITFEDKATGFTARYKYPPQSVNLDDEFKKRLEYFDGYDIENGIYACDLQIKDLNNDGIDEIVYTKFIPGLFHNDALGIIDYTFNFENGTYKVQKEVLRDWWDNRLIKQINIS